MRSLLVIAALLAAFPGHARMWVDQECMNILVRYEAGFLFVREDMIITCQIADWPIDQAVATMACARDQTTTLEILDDNTVAFGEIPMSRYEGPIPCGDNDAEWPD